VKFKTSLEDEDQSKFQNEATVMSDNVEDVKAASTVSVQRGVPLKKTVKGYNGSTQTITWEVQYNYNEKTISRADAVLL
ncbi:hypothetical protein, partial [Anaerobacillus sp. 1_MG-2023]|uniref:hypothetical protein n=1 Tax=Anaerobacillus sp. 1_MG-2023 TaxID=3062655 RepID=UPI0026E27F98